MIRGIIGVFHIGGALMHIWNIGRYLEVWRLEHWRCISAYKRGWLRVVKPLSAYKSLENVDLS